MNLDLTAVEGFTVEHESLVVTGVDVAKDAAGSWRLASAADGNDDRRIMAGALATAVANHAELAWCEREGLGWIVVLDFASLELRRRNVVVFFALRPGESDASRAS